jgi:hypothetical protein
MDRSAFGEGARGRSCAVALGPQHCVMLVLDLPAWPLAVAAGTAHLRDMGKH